MWFLWRNDAKRTRSFAHCQALLRQVARIFAKCRQQKLEVVHLLEWQNMAGVLPRWLWRTSGSREQTSTRRSSWTGSLFNSVPLSRHEGLMRRCNRKNHEKTQYQYTADAPSVMDALLYYDIAALHCFMALVLQHRLHLRGWRREILCSSLHEFQQFEKTILGSSWSFSCQVSFLNIQWSAMIRDLFCCQVKLHGCRATCGSGLVASCGILWHLVARKFCFYNRFCCTLSPPDYSPEVHSQEQCLADGNRTGGNFALNFWCDPCDFWIRSQTSKDIAYRSQYQK